MYYNNFTRYTILPWNNLIIEIEIREIIGIFILLFNGSHETFFYDIF